jgi:hypothetical protein
MVSSSLKKNVFFFSGVGLKFCFIRESITIKTIKIIIHIKAVSFAPFSFFEQANIPEIRTKIEHVKV